MNSRQSHLKRPVWLCSNVHICGQNNTSSVPGVSRRGRSSKGSFEPEPAGKSCSASWADQDPRSHSHLQHEDIHSDLEPGGDNSYQYLFIGARAGKANNVIVGGERHRRGYWEPKLPRQADDRWNLRGGSSFHSLLWPNLNLTAGDEDLGGVRPDGQHG